MAKLTYKELVPDSEKKWRGATFFTAVADTEVNADKKLEKLFKKYLKDKPHEKKVEL